MRRGVQLLGSHFRLHMAVKCVLHGQVFLRGIFTDPPSVCIFGKKVMRP